MTDAPLRPKDVCDRLGVPATTLRLWSVEFAPWLSPGAQPATTERGTTGHRRYTETDVEIFRRIQAWLVLDLTYDEVRRLLAAQTPPEPPAESPVGDSIAVAGDPAGEFLALLRRSVALQEEIAAGQARIANALERRIAAQDAPPEPQTMKHTQAAPETPQGPSNDATGPSWWIRLRRMFRGGEHG